MLLSQLPQEQSASTSRPPYWWVTSESNEPEGVLLGRVDSVAQLKVFAQSAPRTSRHVFVPGIFVSSEWSPLTEAEAEDLFVSYAGQLGIRAQSISFLDGVGESPKGALKALEHLVNMYRLAVAMDPSLVPPFYCDISDISWHTGPGSGGNTTSIVGYDWPVVGCYYSSGIVVYVGGNQSSLLKRFAGANEMAHVVSPATRQPPYPPDQVLAEAWSNTIEWLMAFNSRIGDPRTALDLPPSVLSTRLQQMRTHWGWDIVGDVGAFQSSLSNLSENAFQTQITIMLSEGPAGDWASDLLFGPHPVSDAIISMTAYLSEIMHGHALAPGMPTYAVDVYDQLVADGVIFPPGSVTIFPREQYHIGSINTYDVVENVDGRPQIVVDMLSGVGTDSGQIDVSSPSLVEFTDVTLYLPDGRTIQVPIEDVAAYSDVTDTAWWMELNFPPDSGIDNNSVNGGNLVVSMLIDGEYRQFEFPTMYYSLEPIAQVQNAIDQRLLETTLIDMLSRDVREEYKQDPRLGQVLGLVAYGLANGEDESALSTQFGEYFIGGIVVPGVVDMAQAELDQIRKESDEQSCSIVASLREKAIKNRASARTKNNGDVRRISH